MQYTSFNFLSHTCVDVLINFMFLAKRGETGLGKNQDSGAPDTND